MKDHMVIMNFTDIYKEQEFWRDGEPAWAELTQLTGCSCYCDEEAAKVLRQENRENSCERYSFPGFRQLSLYEPSMDGKNRHAFPSDPFR